MIKILKEAEVSGKRVFLRVDLNLTRDLKGKIVDDFRLRAVLPTIKYLISKKSKIIIASHFGNPDGKPDKKLTLAPIAKMLSRQLKKKVIFVPNIIGSHVEAKVATLKPGKILILENLRFDPREEQNSLTFVKQLARLADIYVNDAFGVAHRNHASIVGLPKVLPSYIGFLFEKEIQVLSGIRTKPKHPFAVLIGGAKLVTKLPILKYFKNKADSLMVGGALCNNFFVAQGYNVGRSFYEPQLVSEAKKLIASKNIILPSDIVLAEDKSGRGKIRITGPDDVREHEYIYDLGPETTKTFILKIKRAQTILWNGPLGLDEIMAFRKSTDAIARAIAGTHGYSVVGGGDTVLVLDRLGITNKFDYISTGGGAMLEYLGKGTLPGLQALGSSR